jgi:polyhydroxybutyrate depolymerase
LQDGDRDPQGHRFLKHLPVLAAIFAVGAPLVACHGRARDVAGREAAAAGEPPVAAMLEPTPLAPGQRLPLLIFLHGYGDTGQDAFEGLALGAFGRRHRVFVVAPNGTPDRRGRRFWNAGGGCCDLDRRGIDDVARIAALIDRWRARPDVDPRRVYVVGHSNGGFMAHRLACAIGDRLAAVASTGGAGPPATRACAVTSPIGVLEVHGDADRIVRYQGGQIFDDPTSEPYLAAPATLDAWAQRLACDATATTDAAATPDIPLLHVERRAPCRLGNAELWTIPGGGHGILSPALLERIWSFLARNVKPAG